MSMPLSLLPLLIFSNLNDRLTLENYWYFFCVCDYHSPIYAYGMCSDSREIFTDCDSFLCSKKYPPYHQGEKKKVLNVSDLFSSLLIIQKKTMKEKGIVVNKKAVYSKKSVRI